MFYCDDCGNEREHLVIPFAIARSMGPCEYCKEVKECTELPFTLANTSDEGMREHLLTVARDLEEHAERYDSIS